MHVSENPTCRFCNGETQKIYRFNDYNIVQCHQCLTSTVRDAPAIEELQDYYQGFTFEANIANLDQIQTTEVEAWLKSHNLPSSARMLDIGGGAGFFAAAFEHFKLGKSTYVDLDEAACRFAREELNLEDVRNSDVASLSDEQPENFDFIYCRHVIEHLIHPTELIDAAIDLLKPGGIFILQFPNGLSLEYLAYPRRIAPYAKKLRNSNNFSWIKTICTLISRKNAFAIDPIRHLWAITPNALTTYLRMHRSEVQVTSTTKSISDPAFSPYYREAHFPDQLRAYIARNTLARLRGGAHAVVTIRKPLDRTGSKEEGQ